MGTRRRRIEGGDGGTGKLVGLLLGASSDVVEENNDEEHAAAHQVGQHAELHVVDHFLCMGAAKWQKLRRRIRFNDHAQKQE